MKRGPEFYPAVKGVSGIYKLKISHIFAISGGSFVQILKFAAYLSHQQKPIDIQ